MRSGCWVEDVVRVYGSVLQVLRERERFDDLCGLCFYSYVAEVP